MDVKYLNYIVTLAKKKNMTKAAEELFVSQSSLSQYLSKLEQEIGTPLFIRAKGELTLTPAGELYIEAAQEVIRIQKGLYHNIRNLNNNTHITIGVTSQFGLRMLTEIIPKFKQSFPNVTIEISEKSVPEVTHLILEEYIDFALMAINTVEPFSPEQVSILRSEEVFFAIPTEHPYHKKNLDQPIPISELPEFFNSDNFLLPRKGSTLRFLSDQIFSLSQYTPNTMCETNSIIATRSMVAMGIGVTLIAESCCSDRSRVAYYSLEPKIYRYNALVRRKTLLLNKAELALCDYIKNYF